uniref:Uncharacterized protein n=1 Tax=Fundidesulfovibrio putealis TaxID=270496 RepID=A0A7C4EMZ0_9BACT
MALRHTPSKIALGFLLVILSSNLAWSGDREELLLVAEDIRSAIQRQDPEGILKYIHGTVCLDPECYTPDTLRQLLKDESSWPNTMLFIGDSSIHEYLQDKTAIHLIENPYPGRTDYWQITLANPEIKPTGPALVFVSKIPSGWMITDIHFD